MDLGIKVQSLGLGFNTGVLDLVWVWGLESRDLYSGFSADGIGVEG